MPLSPRAPRSSGFGKTSRGWTQRFPLTKQIGVFLLLTMGAALALWFLLSLVASPTGRHASGGVSYGESSTGMPSAAPYYDGVDDAGYDRDMATEEKVRVSDAMLPLDYYEGGAGNIEDVFGEERQIIRDGSLEMVVEDTESAVHSSRSIAAAQGGFVEHVNVYETRSDEKRGSVTLRVPEEAFDVTLEQLKELALEVVNESSNARDVTEQAVDLEARLSNERDTEERYLAVLEEASDVEDILRVERELSRVRGTIERLEAQLENLKRQVVMSRIHVEFVSQSEAEVGAIVWKPLNVVKESFRALVDQLIMIANGLIAFIFYLPVLLFWLVIVGLIGWGGYRIALFLKRKFE